MSSKTNPPARHSKASIDLLKEAARRTVLSFVETLATAPDVKALYDTDVVNRMASLRESRVRLFVLSSHEIGVRDAVAVCVEDGDAVSLHIFVRRDGIWRYVRRDPNREAHSQVQRSAKRKSATGSPVARRPRKRVAAG